MGPYISEPVPFVRHDEAGRITERGRMEMRYIVAEDAEHGGILAGEAAEDTHHVEDPTGPARRLRLRRALVVAFDTREPVPGAPARVVLPPDTLITVAGPVTGTARAGGAVDLVLRVPGTYRVTMEAWPRRPVTETLTVPVTEGPAPEAPAGAVVIGPDLETVRARAKEIATFHYAALALISRPAGLQAADLLKAAEAEKVLAGGESEWIAEEAAERGQDPAVLAAAIVAESTKTVDRERERVRVTQAVARATTESEVVAALQAAGLEFVLPPGP
ncbi:hypothetical protein SQ03_05400 [Methylobacterium platani JCM 14648]|uniref:Uncharacterized protein n=3 Tax=Methylobacterium platani TaxID=427683 RepID=A0A179SEI3_9HYPH|nr:hypothetical protein SQ03_05400 [Methylobacterium platani JCM 14648]OAS26277.1 hypothetical protein A5481_06045 [Methylobacterium platani]